MLLNVHYALASCSYVTNVSNCLVHIVKNEADVIPSLGTIRDFFNYNIYFSVFHIIYERLKKSRSWRGWLD